MENISKSLINHKRLTLLSKISSEESSLKLQEIFDKAIDELSESIDEKAISFLRFLSRLDNISDLSDENKELYSVGNRKVHIINTQKALLQAIDDLFKSKVVGFDTEQKPTFVKGEAPSKIAIVQLSNQHNSYIIQVQQLKDLKPLLDLLSSSKVIKVGIGLKSDNQSLYNEFKVEIRNCIDFGLIFKDKLDYQNEIGAKKGVLFFLNKKLQKSGRASRSNWENKELTTTQIKYASEDASCVYDVFFMMLLKYPYLLEILPRWFKIRYEQKQFQRSLEEFKLLLI